MVNETRYWFVLFTRPLWEKKVQETITKFFGIEAWCPLKKVARRWSDRIKIIEEPYFRNYVFVHATEKERAVTLDATGVIECVRFLGKPARVSEQEINNIKDFIEGHSDVEVRGIEPKDRVTFYNGAFVDQEAEVLRIEGTKAVLTLKKLNCVMTATLTDVKKGGVRTDKYQ
jgi:transcription antitermination factor NusG